MKINHIITEFVQQAPVAVPADDAPPAQGYAIKVHGPFGARQGGIAAATLWYALSAVFPDRYPPKDYQNYGAQLDSPQARVLNQIHRTGSAVVADGIAGRDLAETLANKLAMFKPEDQYLRPLGSKHVEVVESGLEEDITRRGFLQGAGAAAVAGVTEGSDNITAVFSGYGNYMKGRGANVFKHYGITVLDKQYFEDEDISEYTVSGDKEALNQARAYLERSDQFGGMIIKQGVAEGSNVDSQIKRIKDRILQLKDWNTAGTHDKKIKELQARLKELQQQKQGVAEGSLEVAEASKQKLMIGSKVTHPDHGKGTVVMHATGGGTTGTVVKFANGKKVKVDHKKLTIAEQGVAEGTAGLPDPNDFDSDWEYQDAMDAYGKEQDTDSDYENMIDDESDDWFDESKEKVGNMDADAFDDALARLKKLAGAGPLKTVYDPNKRVYKNVPHAVQPAQQPKKAR